MADGRPPGATNWLYHETTDEGLLLLLTPEAAGMDASMTIKHLNIITGFKVVQSVISGLLDGWLSKTNHWTRPHL